MKIIDFTRRNDPACSEAVELLDKQLKSNNHIDIFTFWSKNPNGIYNLYKDHIKKLLDNKTIVFGMFTITGYGEILEPGIDMDKFHRMDKIVNLIGSNKIKLRFDPIIPGYTTIKHLIYFKSIVDKYNIQNVIYNFINVRYKKIKEELKNVNITVDNRLKHKWVNILHKTFRNYNIHACAEARLTDPNPEACISKQWILSYIPNANPKHNKNNRLGCLCCNTDDWGLYSSWKNSYKCPHGCLYCYAK